jgi:hypothetical protein
VRDHGFFVVDLDFAAAGAAVFADVSAMDFDADVVAEALRCRRRLDFFTALVAVSAGAAAILADDVGTADLLVVAFLVVPCAPATPATASSASEVRMVRDRMRELSKER